MTVKHKCMITGCLFVVKMIDSFIQCEMYDYWLSNKDYDIKIVCIKLPKYRDYKGFKVEMIKNRRDAERHLDYILSENYKAYYRDKYMQD